jgi:hypothetical protein
VQVDEDEAEDQQKEKEDEKRQDEFFKDAAEYRSEEKMEHLQTFKNKKFISFYPAEKKSTAYKQALEVNTLHFRSENLADRKKIKQKFTVRHGMKAHMAMEGLHVSKKIILRKNVVSCKSIKMGICSSQFWILFVMIILSSCKLKKYSTS